MSLWRRRGVESRLGSPFWVSPRPFIEVQRAGFADIDASEVDTSLQSVAIRSTVDLIASLGSELPKQVFRGKGTDRVELPVPRWLEDPGGDGHGLEDWCYRVLLSWLVRGNVYGEELGRQSGHRTQMELFHPDCVTGFVEDGEPVFMVNGRPAAAGFVHRRVNPVPGLVVGLSPIAYHASSIGLSLTSAQFGLQWFRDGAHPTTMLMSTERTVDETLARRVKDRFMAALRGSREPVVLDKGWQAEQLQVSAEESQFLATQEFTAAECCRIYGPGFAEILGYETGGSLTYSNIQERSLDLLKYGMDKWLRRMDRLLSEFLPRPQYVRTDRDALLETSTVQRFQAHASALDKRWKTVNEVRQAEMLPPVPWGDRPNSAASGVQVTPIGGSGEEDEGDQL